MIILSFYVAQQIIGLPVNFKDNKFVNQIYADAVEFEPYSFNLISFYEANAGYGQLPSSSSSFAAFVITPVDDQLYLGLGQEPAIYDGALVVRFDNINQSLQKIPITNNPEGMITEQGIHVLVRDPDTQNLFFPGTDPTLTDGWEFGNAYVIDGLAATGTKYRENSGLTEVVHGWGATVDSDGSYYYGSGSLVTVPYSIGQVGAGEVFKSIDKGVTWQRITTEPSVATSSSSFLSPSRVYGLNWMNNHLYAVTSERTMYSTANNGASWELITQAQPVKEFPVKVMITANGNSEEFLLAEGTDRQTIFKINTDNSVEQFVTPFRIETTYNSIASDGEWIYVISSDLALSQNGVYRSKDLSNWQMIDTLPAYDSVNGGTIAAIAYWPDENELLVSTRGVNAKLYHLNVGMLVDPFPTNTPTPSPTHVVTTNSNTNSNSNNSSSNSTTEVGRCSQSPPGSSPNLFQITAGQNTAKLYFVPAGTPYDRYMVTYGKTYDNLPYGFEYNQAHSSGVLSLDIGSLSPNTVYYFKVRGGNGCAPGEWSQTVAARTTLFSRLINYYPNSIPIPTTVLLRSSTPKVAVKSTASDSSSEQTETFLIPTPIQESIRTVTQTYQNQPLVTEVMQASPVKVKRCILWICW